MNRTVRGSQSNKKRNKNQKKKREKTSKCQIAQACWDRCVLFLYIVVVVSVVVVVVIIVVALTISMIRSLIFFFVALELKQIQLYSLCLFTYFKWQTMLRYAIVYRTAGTLPYIFNGTDKISLKL